MNNTLNMTAIFNSMDARRAAAEATLAKFSSEQVAEASRVAFIYARCDKTSLKHLEDIAKRLAA